MAAIAACGVCAIAISWDASLPHARRRLRMIGKVREDVRIALRERSSVCARLRRRERKGRICFAMRWCECDDGVESL